MGIHHILFVFFFNIILNMCFSFIYPLCIICFIFLNIANGLRVNVGPMEETCFVESINDLDKVEGIPMLNVDFQVLSGGRLDINVYIRHPSNILLVNQPAKKSGQYSFEMDVEGDYTICFSNRMSTVAHKLVSFDIKSIVNEIRGLDATATQEGVDATSDMVDEAYELLEASLIAQHRLRERELSHHDMSDSNHSNVLVWEVFQFALVVCLCIFQVYYIRRIVDGKG